MGGGLGELKELFSVSLSYSEFNGATNKLILFSSLKTTVQQSID